MRIRIGIWILLLGVACSGPEVTKGRASQWVKGKALSIQGQFVSGGSPLQLGVRNDSTGPLAITPIRTVGWFREGGERKSDYTFGEFGPASPMVQASYAVTGPGGEVRTVTMNAQNPAITLKPGEEIQINFDFWKGGRTEFDALKRVQVVIGREGYSQENFVIE